MEISHDHEQIECQQQQQWKNLFTLKNFAALFNQQNTPVRNGCAVHSVWNQVNFQIIPKRIGRDCKCTSVLHAHTPSNSTLCCCCHRRCCCYFDVCQCAHSTHFRYSNITEVCATRNTLQVWLQWISERTVWSKHTTDYYMYKWLVLQNKGMFPKKHN